MTRRLARNVVIGRTSHLAGSELSDELAAKVTNPRAWADGDADVTSPGAADAADGAGADDGSRSSSAPPVERPKDSGSKEAWVAYAKSGGASDDDLDGLNRDDLRKKYG